MKEKISEFVYSHREEMVDIIRQLVEIPSVKGKPEQSDPFGAEPRRALDKMLEICREHGFVTGCHDNVMGTADYAPSGKVGLGILCHLDVVPAEPLNWSCPPFQLTRRDGKLFGRGVIDDKGPCAASLMALYCIKELGIPLKKGVRLLFGTDEENGSEDLEIYRSTTDRLACTLTREGVTCYNHLLQPVEKEISHVDWEISAAEKGGYEHFMFKEIMEQPKALRDTIFPRLRDGEVVLDEVSLTREELERLDRLYVIACGSSYHVGVAAKYTLERLLRIPVEVTLASEFRYCAPIVTRRTLAVVISQSGETIDTLAAMREARRLGARLLSIVNVVGSTIARESDDVIYTWAGPEIAVATTKAYSTQLAVIYLLGLRFAHLLGTVGEEEYAGMVAQLRQLPAKVEEILSDTEKIQYYASIYFNHDSVFYIGRNIDYAVGLEGSLKLKEISYIHSEAYAAGELKHGTISLIEDGTLVVALASWGDLFDKLMSNVKEVKARGADVVGITTRSHGAELAKSVDSAIQIPDTHPMFLPSLEVVPMQLFAYYVALMRGCDIDKPRNLAKSVTVE